MKSMFYGPEWEKIQEGARKAEQERQKRIDNHPDNGKLGWWRVHGIRHDATVKASTAREAIQKAIDAEVVGDWEMAEAWFWTTELPDVI